MPKFLMTNLFYNATLKKLGLVALVILFSGIFVTVVANAGTPLNIAGYLDFSYGTTVKEEPTAEKPESKLWWHDGYWWGILYNPAQGAYRIYRLNWGTQTWEDTSVAVDGREDSRADVLWDSSANKLYVASHFKFSNPAHTSNDAEKGRLYRYSYNQSLMKYVLDSGFPVNVNSDKTETLVVDKDSTGRLWVTYVSKDMLSVDTRYAVYANSSSDGGATWGIPFIIPVTGHFVALDDISSLIAFEDNGGKKIGVMWSNQIDSHYYFATHDDSQAPESGWNVQTVDTSPYPVVANDHINLAKSANNQVFAAVRTGNLLETDPLIGLVARDLDGNFSFHVFNNVDSKDTRPIALVHNDENRVYVFVASNPLGGRICYKSAAIPANLANLSFPVGNCEDIGTGGATEFIADSNYSNINHATSTKQNLNNITGLVVLASDDPNGHVYVHNVMGNPPPVITGRYPQPGKVILPEQAGIVVTFSKPINQSTLTNSTFTVEDSGGQVSGSLTYQSASRSVKFTPATPFQVDETYTVTVTNGVKDTGGIPLYRTVKWSFTVAEGSFIYLPVITRK
jgi:hypothetical protein